MPYMLVGNCVHKQNEDGKAGEVVPGGCHETEAEAKKHMRALYANVRDSAIVEFSMRISKAAFNKSEAVPMNWSAIDSDVDPDLYEESMSPELYQDFVDRIENDTPVPDPFRDAVCEADWCGGMPYLSIAHFKAGSGMINVPGSVDSVFIDGKRLKSKGKLYDNELGRRTFDSLRKDLYLEKSDTEHKPVRISIGFLDLEHKHRAEAGGQEFTFTRTDLGQICPMCAQGIGGKVYTKGQLIHLAMTRVPVNPRTRMMVENSMDEIVTKKDDAKSIVGDLAEGLEEKSIAEGVLVVRSDGVAEQRPNTDMSCYDPATDTYNQDCVNSAVEKVVPQITDYIGQPVKSTTLPKQVLDAAMTYLYKSNGYELPVTEAGMDEKVEKEVVVEPAVAEVVAPAKADTKSVKEADEKNDVDEESGKKDGKKNMKSSALDESFEALKGMLAEGKSVDEIQAAFNALGTEVEKSFTPAPAPVVAGVDVETLKSIIESAVAPLRVEIATLKAQKSETVSDTTVVKSKALSIGQFSNPNQLLQKSQGAPVRQRDPNDNVPAQIRALARKSTGLQD